jgi:hypothetical protein
VAWGAVTLNGGVLDFSSGLVVAKALPEMSPGAQAQWMIFSLFVFSLDIIAFLRSDGCHHQVGNDGFLKASPIGGCHGRKTTRHFSFSCGKSMQLLPVHNNREEIFTPIPSPLPPSSGEGEHDPKSPNPGVGRQASCPTAYPRLIFYALSGHFLEGGLLPTSFPPDSIAHLNNFQNYWQVIKIRFSGLSLPKSLSSVEGHKKSFS